MAYTNDLAALVATHLDKLSGFTEEQLTGQVLNLDFWLGEAEHALAVIDDYPARFARLRTGQTGLKRIPSDQMELDRRAIKDAGCRLLRRLLLERLLEEPVFRASCARLSTSVDLDDLEAYRSRAAPVQDGEGARRPPT